MITIRVRSWDKAKRALQNIECERTNLRTRSAAVGGDELLYRGHANERWGLITTLERASPTKLSLPDYYRQVLKTRPQVEAFSDKRWELMELPEYSKWAESKRDLYGEKFPGYEYMIYLRHHGFPSPLLDWSKSPYVAAFFAFRSIPPEARNVAIFCYLETVAGFKSWSGDDPQISVRGPYARSHRRHFIQQCKYTLCTTFANGVLTYENHNEVFKSSGSSQDFLWKIVIPRTSRAEALKDLDKMNVNALSLMGSEDALIETLSTREYVCGED